MNALDPECTAVVELESYGHRPAAARPRFRAHYLTARDWLRYRDLLRQAPDTPDEQGLERLTAALALALVGWENVADSGGPVAFSSAAVQRLPDLLTFAELWELAYGVLKAVQLSEADRKKSASPSPSPTCSETAKS